MQSLCSVDLQEYSQTPNMLIGDIFNIPGTPYSLELISLHCGEPNILNDYSVLRIKKNGVQIGESNYYVGEPNTYLYDSSNICIHLIVTDCGGGQFAAYEFWYTPQATHRLDLIVEPWSYYTPDGAAQDILLKISDINGAILNVLSDYGIMDYQYLNTEVLTSGSNVIVRVNLRQITQGVSTLAVPAIVWAVLILVAVAVIIIGIGKILDYIFCTIDGNCPTAGITNQQLADANAEYVKSLLDGCETRTCSDPSLTQDQKTLCIKNCYDNILTKFKDYQQKIYPKADHTPIDTAKLEVQKCYDVYTASQKTSQDYTDYINCLKINVQSQVDKDKNNVLVIYPPNSPAGSTAAVLPDCWIKSPVGGCILSARAGKAIVIIGVLAAGGYMLYKFTGKRR